MRNRNQIKGYYIGYKELSASGSGLTSSTYTYKTIEVNNQSGPYEANLTNLERQTKYSIIVQAFNVKGAGRVNRN